MSAFIARPDLPTVFAWESQACQYPQPGGPGIVYFRGQLPDHYVDCLLHYDMHGNLTGILNHYNFTNEWESEGNINIWVHPQRQRRGIGTALLTEAEKRWGPINYQQQRYTAAGAELANRFIRQRALGGEE